MLLAPPDCPDLLPVPGLVVGPDNVGCAGVVYPGNGGKDGGANVPPLRLVHPLQRNGVGVEYPHCTGVSCR